MKTSFRRYEIKYLLPANYSGRILPQLLNYMDFDPYMFNEDHYQVVSLYYDTPALDCYHDKLAGLKNRRKFRLRCYDSQKNSNFFLEIKRRHDLLIVKDRVFLGKGLLNDVNFGNLAAYQNRIIDGGQEVMDEFTYYDARFRLVPQVLVEYKRKALFSKQDEKFRVTFDYDLKCRNADGNYLQPIQNVLYGDIILEVKFNNYLPKWFHEMILMYQLERVSFSKYGACIEKAKFGNDYE